ncbi:DUF397 domain-containing protein [Streptomyces sp. NPDC057654]|uniref:DUF397 domain-containing protein n=1 Tax=Streptomyces sp. NPDC057654 TaxID=3346196 RepID=UPI00368F84EE
MTRNPVTDNDATAWFKSSYSGGEGNACVEIADCASAVRVRDSKDTTIPGLTVSKGAWAFFIAGIQE